MRILRIVLQISALVFSVAGTYASANVESTLVINGLYLDGERCLLDVVENGCNLTVPGVRCVSITTGLPAFKTTPEFTCTIPIYHPPL